MDAPPPVGAEICGVATDDTFFFHTDKATAATRLAKLDRVLEEHGMPKNAAKDVTIQPHMTALGCELSANPPAAEPATAKLVPLASRLCQECLRSCRDIRFVQGMHAMPGQCTGEVT